jgi:hypothetical protein
MTGAMDHLAPYRVLVEIAETELALTSAGHWGELAGVHDAWGNALDALPPRPPADAEPLLRRALALSEQSEQVIAAARDAVMRELGDVGRQRDAGRAYQPAVAVSPTLQLNLSA